VGCPPGAAHQAERKRLYEREFPETRHGGDRKSSRQNGNLINDVRYTVDAAKKTGTSERSLQREVSRGESIPKVGLLAGTSLETPEQLDALVTLPWQEQQPLNGRNWPMSRRKNLRLR
jgi:hypothetical protein